ncbi:pumilio homolog 6, chloroplastic-like [Vicia villosa]|uniref:pumilio homolog 6, chloroplastic-like n=1 Tax=Vicia villosa TaxID=3911 RepID=UPI00273C319A|nr:pumilio homolog 6, chloroplastic-like [Vicia villosa]XP_058756603.1 pumilio homolog 6, chloroplastic-like [Vicia villosa]XP_058756604.1 pumilio homolog 6, chloroplastic-like [Vicia villosa]
MATESPIRISEAGGKWPSHIEASAFGTPPRNMGTEDLGILLKGHRFRGSSKDVAPNRSGSAPPSMEGSFLAIENLLPLQNTQDASLTTLSRAVKNCESEDQLRADPAYLAYYNSNVNLNPRLPPPLTSWENRHIGHHIGSSRNNWGLPSADHRSKNSLHLPQATLSTHKEESEDDSSQQQAQENESVNVHGVRRRQDAASMASQQKNVVDLIQEDFPRTMSPVYNMSLSISHGLVDKPIELEAASSSSHDPHVTAVESAKPTAGVVDVRVSSSVDVHSPVASSSTLGSTASMGFSNIDVATVAYQLKTLNVSNLPNSESLSYEEKLKTSYQNNMMQQQVFPQQSSQSEVPSTNSQSVNNAYVGREQFAHNSSKLSDVQPLLQSSGFTPPLYATAAAYMASVNPYYTNMQASGSYAPQYVGGYTLNPTAIHPYISSYPPHGAVPFVVDGATSSSYAPLTPGVSTGGSISHGAEMVQANKYLGQFGYPVQPSFGDPIYMQYNQQAFVEGFGISGHFEPHAPRASGVNQMNPYDSQKRPGTGAYLDDKKLHEQRTGANMNSRRGGLSVPSYFGPMPNTGFVMQYPSSPLSSPVLSGYPEGSPGLSGGRNEMKPFPASGRNGGMLSGWHGQRSFDSAQDPKIVNFLEELKSGKGRRFELSDIIGHIVEFSADQHGSRFIQQKLESCGVEEKALVFKEVLPHASKLMTDVFGNYVIQKFFEYGNPEQRKELADKLAGQILPLSLQMYGCRVIQKALEVIEHEQKAQLVRELDGNIMRCVRDQNGNHVIQKCIESIPTQKIGFILSAFRGQVANLSMHPYGCRVIQRILEHCTDEVQCQFIVDEILESVCSLAQDQYGNYVTQHVLERGRPQERSQIISKLSGHVVQFSQHKFASNVVEKCLEYGDPSEREVFIVEIIGHDGQNDNLLTMMKDQFANYVIQKVIDICSDNQRAILLSHIRIHANALKKYTYGKHIVARLEHQFGENQTPDS